jgi:hypothetical protein
MTVWVDPLRDWGWRLGPSCHLMADSREELHVFAARIGLRRSWFQDKLMFHYDLTAARRAAAVRAGALELDWHEAVLRHPAVAPLAPPETSDEARLDNRGPAEDHRQAPAAASAATWPGGNPEFSRLASSHPAGGQP